MRFHRIPLSALVCTLATCSSPPRPAEPPKTPYTVSLALRQPETDPDVDPTKEWESIVRHYEACPYYRDTGITVTNTWLHGDRTVEARRFATELIRGRGFRFRFWDEAGELTIAIWSPDPSHVYTRSFNEVRQRPRVTDELQAFAGIADGTTLLVPWLLMGRWLPRKNVTTEFLGYVFGDLRGSVILARPSLRPNAKVMLTVDRQAGLIRRIEVLDTRRGTDDQLVFYEPSCSETELPGIVSDIATQPW